jgi:hypothetical protein
VRLYFLLFITIYWFFLILAPINARADEKWDFAKLDGFTYGALAGEVTHGDKLRFIMRKDHCDTVQHIVTFYTYQKPDDIYQLKGQKIPVHINDVSGYEIKVFMVRPFLMGYLVWFSLGSWPVDTLATALKEFNSYEIKIVDGHGFKAKKYFDITINNWELDNVGDAFQRIKSNCLELSEIENKLIS